MGSGSVARRAGEAVEDRVLERTAFAHVPDAEATWYDAETPPGFPVEIKGAVRERSKGDRTAPGLWWIQKRHHDRLVEAGGFYALVVYAPDRTAVGNVDVEIVRYALVPAPFVSSVVSTWMDVDGHASGAQRAAQLRWTEVFEGGSA